MTKLVAFHTLGCKLNFSETSTLAREFQNGDFTRTTDFALADIIVLNTCSVTGEADKKCRSIIRKFTHTNPSAIIVVTGCYAQLKPQEIAAIEGVDLVIGNNAKDSLVQQVAAMAAKSSKPIVDSCQAAELTNFFSAFSSGDRTRTFLKVQDGCSYHCSYCTIPLARGQSRNIPIAQLVSQAEAIAARGQREIVLTGVNIGDFGRSTNESFLDLITQLHRVSGIDRYRISSIEPNLLTDEVISFCANSQKFMPHFHIPLQAGTNKILALMRRRYTVEKFAERIAAVRTKIPHAFIGIDVIVGFPGETSQDFKQSMDFLKSITPSFLHIFPYSERDNTDAISLDGKVATHEKHLRVKQLTELSDALHSRFAEQFIGSQAHVLVESTRHGNCMFGFTENYLRVELPYDREKINTIQTVRLGPMSPEGNMTTLN